MPSYVKTPDPLNLSDEDIGILVCMARHRIGLGREARENLRVFFRGRKLDLATFGGESDADWERGTRLAQAVVEEYGHLYDASGKRIPSRGDND